MVEGVNAAAVVAAVEGVAAVAATEVGVLPAEDAVEAEVAA